MCYMIYVIWYMLIENRSIVCETLIFQFLENIFSEEMDCLFSSLVNYTILLSQYYYSYILQPYHIKNISENVKKF